MNTFPLVGLPRTHSSKSWYELNVEEPIRPIVKLLRDNGFNTISSCGHSMFVQCTLYYDKPVLTLIQLLRDNNYKRFKIKIETEHDYVQNCVINDFIIFFPREDGTIL